ncbi:uncharacterized protein A4U43_C07F34260 [Asparagus officinalis]|uniref:Protein TIFY n=1 Tax=Asparagus officinalis TaxID=4686 RepID=A0A5P1EGX8_ASPOF|nr:protein TIFY 5A-like [Asparagus officinalis]ONK65155.1 uncharacterized protein A4U43_C07F34260 [Asparagus officinalis]
MDRVHDPELELRLGSSHHSSSADSNSSMSSTVTDWLRNDPQYHHHQHQQQQHFLQRQQITFFYNGNICVGDVTEIQARAIICMAKKETAEGTTEKNKEIPSSSQFRPAVSPTPATDLGPPLMSPGLSMKRSLQRFLQKRKTRMDAASPYNSCTVEWDRQ